MLLNSEASILFKYVILTPLLHPTFSPTPILSLKPCPPAVTVIGMNFGIHTIESGHVGVYYRGKTTLFFVITTITTDTTTYLYKIDIYIYTYFHVNPEPNP